MRRLARDLALRFGFLSFFVCASAKADEKPFPVIVSGVVRDINQDPVEDAIVIFSCSCLEAEKIARTNVRGIYSVRQLPTGSYTVQVAKGDLVITKRVDLHPGQRLRLSFPNFGRQERRRVPQPKADLREEEGGREISGRRFPPRFGFASDLRGQVFASVLQHPISAVGIRVGSGAASYPIARSSLRAGRLPPPHSIRLEEMVNYFHYGPIATKPQTPVTLAAEVGPCPWNPKHTLLRVDVRAPNPRQGAIPPRNLVFLLDTSTSMSADDRLPLLKRALGGLVSRLRPQDRLAIVAYGGAASPLAPTRGSKKTAFERALRRLKTGGWSHGSNELAFAYRLAHRHYNPEGINRVILGTDGDLQVGRGRPRDVTSTISAGSYYGVQLSVLEVGRKTEKDEQLQVFADHGDGLYAHLDSVEEALRVLVAHSNSTASPIAHRPVLRATFNPEQVSAYRLLGFRNDAPRPAHDHRGPDGAPLPAGGQATLLYELTPRRVRAAPESDERDPRNLATTAKPLVHLELSYHRLPHNGRRRSVSATIDSPTLTPKQTSSDFRFAAAVAEASLLLQDARRRGRASWPHVISSAQGALGSDPLGVRREFVQLAKTAAAYGRVPSRRRPANVSSGP